MIKINKLAVIALCSLFSISLHAQEDSLNIESQEQETPAIYLMKEKDGSTFFTDKPSRYSHLSIDNKTYYPTSDIHGHNSWRINCTKKKFDNMKICYMKQGDLWVFLINGSYSVSVGTDHYPRTTAGLRIDTSPAIYGYEGDLPKPLSIIERLKKGKVAYTRYQKWPYQYNKDGEVSLLEFTEQFNEMLKQYKNL